MRNYLLFFIITNFLLVFSSCKHKNNLTHSSYFIKKDDEILKEEIIKIFPQNNQKIKIEKINEGASDSRIYKIICADKTLVARFLNTARPMIKRKTEIFLMKKTSEKLLSPKIYFVSSDNSLIIMDYIEGQKITKKHFENNQFIISLANKINLLHNQIKCKNCSIRTISLKNIKTSNKEYESFLDYFHKLEKDFLKNSKISLTHMDLNAGNIIINNDIPWIIDWQESGLYGPLFDIAYIVTELQLSSQKEEIFLQEYLHRKMTKSEEKSYKEAKILASIKIINSLLNDYLPHCEDKSLCLKKILSEFKNELSEAENKVITRIQDNPSVIAESIDNVRLAIIYLLRKTNFNPKILS